MSARKLKRRGVRLQYRGEIFRAYELGTGEYASTYFVWNATRDRTAGVNPVDGGKTHGE